MDEIQLGCGHRPVLKRINVDFRSRAVCGVTDRRYTWIIADAQFLPFKPGSLNRIVARHIIEHFSWRDTSSLVKEWYAALGSGGQLEVTCPNIQSYSWRMLEAPPNKQRHMIRHMWGDQDYPGNFHHTGFTPTTLEMALRKRGISVESGVLPLYSIKDAQCKAIATKS